MSDITLLLSKTLPQLVLPLGASIFLLFIALLVSRKQPKLARRCTAIALAMLLIFSLPITSQSLIYKLENHYPPIDPKLAAKVDAIFLLGGGLSPAVAPRYYSQLGPGADRLLLTHKLFNAGKVGRIIVLSGPENPESKSDAVETLDILTSWGIPADAIVLDKTSLNTAQNATAAMNAVTTLNIKSAYLVTSASHMLRSMAIFRANGVLVTAMPADHWVPEELDFSINQWIPSATSLAGSSIVLREYLGLLYYAGSNKISASNIYPRKLTINN